MIARDSYHIFSSAEIKNILQNNRTHQTNVYKALLKLIPEKISRYDNVKARMVIKNYCLMACTDDALLHDIQLQVNREQVIRILSQFEKMEMADTDMYLTIMDALNNVNRRDRRIVYCVYVSNYNIEEVAGWQKEVPELLEKWEESMEMAIRDITLELQREECNEC